MTRSVRIAALALVAAAWPLESPAEILAIPFFGGTFHGQARLPLFDGVPDVEPSSLSKSVVIGVAGVWLGSGLFGAEAELAHSPGFFERTESQPVPSSIVSSSMTTLSGNLIVTLPLSVTRESLRPYVVGGLGLLHIGVSDVDVISETSVDRNLLALSLGGGAIGMLSEHSGVRFDIRKIRSISDERTSAPPFASGSGVRLSYWRATVGVTLRY